MHYRTYGDLSTIIRANIGRYQAGGYDLVVGIPRSGMIPAYMVGLFLNVNVCSFQQFRDNVRFEQLGRRPLSAALEFPSEARHVLIVDDTYNTGIRLSELMDTLAPEVRGRCDTSVIYALNEDADVDFYLEVLPLPRVFEWNIYHHDAYLLTTAFDMDGVLCRDPTAEENDDGPLYRQFIRTAEPLFLPSTKIGAIITSRLEKYRPETEGWLGDHGVTYENLIMLNMASAEERRQKQAYGSFKAQEYVRGHYTLFIESEEHQAIEINHLSHKPVYCVASNRIIDEPVDVAVLQPPRRIRDRIARVPLFGPALQTLWHAAKGIHPPK